MASGQPSEKQPANKYQDLVTRFRNGYEVALAEAEISATHTATDGWQRLYANHQRDLQERRRQMATNLKNLADIMERNGLDEDGEKEIAEVKKSSTAVRERNSAFILDTVDPVRKAVNECERVIEDARNLARLEEANAPLVNVGLEEVMRDAIAKVSRAKWDNESGRVTIEKNGN